MISKHLRIVQDIMLHTSSIYLLSSCYMAVLLHDTRFVRKYSNSICLTRHGSYGCLEDGGKLSPQTSSKCHPTETINCHLFKSSAFLKTKPSRHDVISFFSKCGSLKQCLTSPLRPLRQLSRTCLTLYTSCTHQTRPYSAPAPNSPQSSAHPDVTKRRHKS